MTGVRITRATQFLKTSKIPVSAVNIGPIHKKDVIKASIMKEHRPE